jgi:hypothetical protein
MGIIEYFERFQCLKTKFHQDSSKRETQEKHSLKEANTM